MWENLFLTIICPKTGMDTLPSSSLSFLSTSIVDEETRIMEILLRLRRGESKDCQADIDDLSAAIAGRKVLLSYKESEQSPITKYMCLNPQTIRRLRSLFIHQGEGFTADYMADVFLIDVYQLEIMSITDSLGMKSLTPGSARAINIAKGDIVPSRSCGIKRERKVPAKKVAIPIIPVAIIHVPVPVLSPNDSESEEDL